MYDIWLPEIQPSVYFEEKNKWETVFPFYADSRNKRLSSINSEIIN